MNKYVIPNELKSETELFKNFAVTDLLFIAAWYVVTDPVKTFVDSRISILWTVFNVGVAFVLTRKSVTNKSKRIYEQWLIYFLRDKNAYHMLDVIEDTGNEADEKNK
jgi:hypothetical protein